MQHLDELRKGVRIAKNDLIKASMILLRQLDEIKEKNEELQNEATLVTERIGFLQEEIMYDVNHLPDAATASHERLKKALQELKHQLVVEKELFETRGDNADRLLDINFRIQEIEAVVCPR